MSERTQTVFYRCRAERCRKHAYRLDGWHVDATADPNYHTLVMLLSGASESRAAKNSWTSERPDRTPSLTAVCPSLTTWIWSPKRTLMYWMCTYVFKVILRCKNIVHCSLYYRLCVGTIKYIFLNVFGYPMPFWRNVQKYVWRYSFDSFVGRYTTTYETDFNFRR